MISFGLRRLLVGGLLAVALAFGLAACGDDDDDDSADTSAEVPSSNVICPTLGEDSQAAPDSIRMSRTGFPWSAPTMARPPTTTPVAAISPAPAARYSWAT